MKRFKNLLAPSYATNRYLSRPTAPESPKPHEIAHPRYIAADARPSGADQSRAHSRATASNGSCRLSSPAQLVPRPSGRRSSLDSSCSE